MSTPQLERFEATPTTLASRLEALARRFAGQCLLATELGEVVCHAVGSYEPSAVLVDAIVQRSVAPLVANRTRPRTVGLVTGGAVIGWQHSDFPGGVLSIPVTHPRQQETWQWLLLGAVPPDVPTLAEAALSLAGSLPMARSADDDAVRAALAGTGYLPDRLVPRTEGVRVLTVHGSGPPNAVEWAMASALLSALPSPIPPVRDGEHVHAVLRDNPNVLREAQAAVVLAAAMLTFPIAAALSDATTAAEPLRRLRDQARLAVSVTPLGGQCVLARDCRAKATLAVIQEQLADVDLWEDPVDQLLALPAGTQLAAAVLAWLESHGDVAAVARDTGVHPNTLRYRLKRAEKVLGTSFDQVDTRLEIHLRLRHRLRGSVQATGLPHPDTISRSGHSDP